MCCGEDDGRPVLPGWGSIGLGEDEEAGEVFGEVFNSLSQHL